MEKWWQGIMRLFDYILISNRSEVFIFCCILLLIFLFFFLLQPLVRLLITLEWSRFISYIITVLLLFLIWPKVSFDVNIDVLLLALFLFAIGYSLFRMVKVAVNKYRSS
ncbi:apolipoprotein N-acyltransferase [Gracilibacillus halotolerans]|uniref:Apolipoprotein N-acyltransferase n=1 Tax=Gracilibacillus halotolerans TaxID=74386 RepID=A0A841RI15_9BACI|nr:hypothetical protein [Gracilibacillus halotolerans]MBB6511293.1 apolipoprotein N-acyltransferase [Gracilibacillus halotolerans]